MYLLCHGSPSESRICFPVPSTKLPAPLRIGSMSTPLFSFSIRHCEDVAQNAQQNDRPWEWHKCRAFGSCHSFFIEPLYVSQGRLTTSLILKIPNHLHISSIHYRMSEKAAFKRKMKNRHGFLCLFLPLTTPLQNGSLIFQLDMSSEKLQMHSGTPFLPLKKLFLVQLLTILISATI